MKILWLAPWFPFPPDNGIRIRLHHLIRALGKQNEIHLISFVRAEDRPSAFALREYCATIEIVPWRDYRSTHSNALAGLFSPTPRSLVDTYSAEMAQCVRQAQGPFDLVIASTIDTASYALLANARARLLEEHNFTTRWMRDEYRREPNAVKRARRWLTFWKYRRYEKKLFAQFDACTMVSDQDAADARTWLDYKNILRVIPNGVDLLYYAPQPIEPELNTLVFNGALTYGANLDAMQFFAAEIWRQIKSVEPSARLSITGRADGIAPDQLPRGKDITLTGYLADLRPTMRQSWVCVVPLRTGSGTRLKILEAMALGTPVVSTSKGAEGLNVTNGEDILLADAPDAFAKQVLRVLRDPQLRARLSRNARQLVESQYGWDSIGAEFCAVAQELSRTQKNADERR